MGADRLLDSFARTTEEIFSLDELRERLDSGRQLKIKYGVDLTAPDLHIGHAVNLWMMREMQDLGHKVQFLIGDFTTRVGDPTDRSQTRHAIAPEQIEANRAHFIEQASMVLRFDDPELLEVRHNSEWYDGMPVGRFLELLSAITHSRLIARDMFQRRIEEGREIHMHEMLYPVLQGYDSYELDSDLTIIGSDQLFNEMLGRFYQERFGQRPQIIVTTKITPGISGREKQSKSLDNYVGLGHSPRDKFGRVMRIPDDLIELWFEVYTAVPLEEVRSLAASEPMEAKKRLAQEIVARYHGDGAAREEREWFERTFSARETPQDAPEVRLPGGELTALELLRACLGEEPSNSELRRLIAQGAVSIDSRKVSAHDETVEVSAGDVVRVGRRSWFRVAPPA
jgi:tyrosyl-tRNA synthetase